ncbi:MAG TPA: LemA family protein [Candidatus Acidoferrales bacterium]|jgi:LemA protein|nr:LemA family protein [Candidatus Acidoferrales bacterium]
MKVDVIILIVLVLVALVVGGSYVSARNHMVTLNEQVKSDWAQVDVVLQRRADLIPNLVNTVEGFAAHETTVFDDVAKARTQYLNAQTPADKIAASNQLYGAEVKVLALAENYPQLKSNQNFLQLQDELAGTENRIAVERRRYDDAIQAYNTYIGLFPNNIFAGWSGFKRNDAYFNAPPEAQQVPKVQFPAPATN